MTSTQHGYGCDRPVFGLLLFLLLLLFLSLCPKLAIINMQLCAAMVYTHPTVSGTSGAVESTSKRIPLLWGTADPIQQQQQQQQQQILKNPLFKRRPFVWRLSFLYRFNTAHLPLNISVTIVTRDFSETDLDLHDSYPPPPKAILWNPPKTRQKQYLELSEQLLVRLTK